MKNRRPSAKIIYCRACRVKGKVFLKKLCFMLGAAALVFTILPPVAAADGWQAKNSRHFIIHHKGVSEAYLNELAAKAESYYRSITDNLGFTRFDLWSWDKRCRIFLYPDSESYLKATGNLSWSRAHVDVVDKHIVTYAGQEEFLEAILPHEMAHIIFREFVGFDKKLPLWLDEGVAILAESDSSQRLRFAEDVVARGRQLSLFDLLRSEGYDSIDPHIFYSQAASMVDFLLNRYGRNNFVDFCRELRRRDDWQEALRRVYRFNSLDDLQKSWLRYVRGR